MPKPSERYSPLKPVCKCWQCRSQVHHTSLNTPPKIQFWFSWVVREPHALTDRCRQPQWSMSRSWDAARCIMLERFKLPCRHSCRRQLFQTIPQRFNVSGSEPSPLFCGKRTNIDDLAESIRSQLLEQASCVVACTNPDAIRGALLAFSQATRAWPHDKKSPQSLYMVPEEVIHKDDTIEVPAGSKKRVTCLARLRIFPAFIAPWASSMSSLERFQAVEQHTFSCFFWDFWSYHVTITPKKASTLVPRGY